MLLFLVSEFIAMPTKLFIGNLVVGVTTEELQMLFEQFGTVTECVVMGNYGFVVSSFAIPPNWIYQPPVDCCINVYARVADFFLLPDSIW